ncbi:50S ribosomal protein L23 [Patescibacteria group bacterium]|nr:50S ribosomal protein L23 [Patescibacteria group bacterium]
MDLNHVLKRPLITEKASVLNAQGRYVFAVDRQATKKEIKDAVEKIFKVKVIGVQTISVKGKKRRSLRTKKQTTQANWKKAIVGLKEGDKIDIFETGT